jgi:predicted NBD/HSP70 family sugar kinase
LTPGDRQAALAIDIGGTSIKFGIIAARAPATVVLRSAAETPAGGDAARVLDAIAREGGRLIAAAAAVGLGSRLNQVHHVTIAAMKQVEAKFALSLS